MSSMGLAGVPPYQFDGMAIIDNGANVTVRFNITEQSGQS